MANPVTSSAATTTGMVRIAVKPVMTGVATRKESKTIGRRRPPKRVSERTPPATRESTPTAGNRATRAPLSPSDRCRSSVRYDGAQLLTNRYSA